MDVDDLFKLTGEFGPYQIRQYILLSIPILFSSYQTVSYIFEAGVPTYRCRVPECEGYSNDTTFIQPWIREAIPFNGKGQMEQNKRYIPITTDNSTSSCYPFAFERSYTIDCDSFVHEGKETTIATEFQIMGDNNAWKVAMVGTLNYLGFFIGMPVSGVFADRTVFNKKFTSQGAVEIAIRYYENIEKVPITQAVLTSFPGKALINTALKN